MIPVLFRDDDIIVVDKPVGISIHNAEDATNLIALLASQAASALFPVHRLDKETSGIQIFALNEKAAAIYAAEFQQRSVRKIYRGILRGNLKDNEGVWTTPISDKAEGRLNPAGLAKDRVPSETRFQVVARSKFFTSCEFDLLTGRQHQIRKHCALAKHALVGDPRYGDKKYNSRMADIYGDTRMFLHCAEIELRGRSFVAPTPAVFDQLVTTGHH